MSPSVIARLSAVQRQTRRYVAMDRAEGRRVSVTDFYCPLRLVQMRLV